MNQIPRPSFPGLDPAFLQHYTTVIDAINTLAGYNGTITLHDHINMGGNQVKNVGSPTDSGDVVQKIYAEGNYSAQAVRPQLEGSGSYPLQTMRQLNSRYQRERTSSYMNDLLSTPPHANTATVFFGASGSSTIVTVNPTIIGLADGTNIAIAGRTDTISNPTSIAITSISSTGSTATATTSSAIPFTAGSFVYISGNANTLFNQGWTVSGVTLPFTFTFQVSFPAASGVGGTVSTGGVYYYMANKNSLTLHLVGGFSADTPQNRLQANYDGSQIVAVAVVNASGGVLTQSGGGGTPTTGDVNGGSFFG